MPEHSGGQDEAHKGNQQHSPLASPPLDSSPHHHGLWQTSRACRGAHTGEASLNRKGKSTATKTNGQMTCPLSPRCLQACSSTAQCLTSSPADLWPHQWQPHSALLPHAPGPCRHGKAARSLLLLPYQFHSQFLLRFLIAPFAHYLFLSGLSTLRTP